MRGTNKVLTHTSAKGLGPLGHRSLFLLPLRKASGLSALSAFSMRCPEQKASQYCHTRADAIHARVKVSIFSLQVF